jgi:hypothetical protein
VLAERSEAFGTRNITPGPRFAASTLGRSVAVNVRHRLSGHSATTRQTPQAGAAV